jgi:hypothetical protein
MVLPTKKPQVVYINIGSGLKGAISPVKYAWRLPQKPPAKAIRDALGWVVAKENEKALVFGANSPKPARVRINFEGGGSTMAFCDPSKLENVTYGGALNKKKWDVAGKFFNRPISSVTAIQG